MLTFSLEKILYIISHQKLYEQFSDYKFIIFYIFIFSSFVLPFIQFFFLSHFLFFLFPFSSFLSLFPYYYYLPLYICFLSFFFSPFSLFSFFFFLFTLSGFYLALHLGITPRRTQGTIWLSRD